MSENASPGPAGINRFPESPTERWPSLHEAPIQPLPSLAPGAKRLHVLGQEAVFIPAPISGQSAIVLMRSPFRQPGQVVYVVSGVIAGSELMTKERLWSALEFPTPALRVDALVHVGPNRQYDVYTVSESPSPHVPNPDVSAKVLSLIASSEWLSDWVEARSAHRPNTFTVYEDSLLKVLGRIYEYGLDRVLLLDGDVDAEGSRTVRVAVVR